MSGTANTVTVDAMTRDEWSAALRVFADATIYQTWDYAQVVFPRQKPSRLAVYRGDEVVAMVQARIVTLPLLKRGIAHVAWGPLWRRKGRGRERDLDALDAVLEALQDEYVVKRRLVLRLALAIPDDDTEVTEALLKRGYTKTQDKPYRTFVLDVGRPVEELRRGLSQKWRNHLKHAERNDLSIEEGTSRRLYDEFLDIYGEMRLRKNFNAERDPAQWRTLQQALPDGEALMVFLVRRDGRAVAGGVFSFMGQRGISIFRATNEESMRCQGSYLLQWRAIAAMRERGCSAYDLGGVDSDANPGVYHFKAGLGGQEVTHMGVWEYCTSPLSKAVVNAGEALRKAKKALARARG